jgi:uncharacterized membrane protein YdjX (TVP38/TMEM64 family)
LDRTKFHEWRRRALNLALLFAGLVLVTSSVRLHNWLVGLLPATEALIRAYPLLGASAFVTFAACSAMLAFVSSAVIVPVGVYVWGKATTLALLQLGWALGGMGTYLLGRYFGHMVVRALKVETVLQRYEQCISNRTPFGLIVLLQLALPSEIPGYVLGLVRYDPFKFLGAISSASLPYAVAAVYLGEGFVDRNLRVLIGVGVGVVAFSAGTLSLLHRRVRDHRVAGHPGH